MSGELQGPFRLDSRTVDVVVQGMHPGAFVLGHFDSKDFVPRLVGGAPGDVAGRIKRYAGRYPAFKFVRCESAFDAFAAECGMYHRFGETRLDNVAHPVRADNSDWQCPLCRQFDRS